MVEFPVLCLSVLKAFPGIWWHSKLQNISMPRHINYNSDWPQCFLFSQVLLHLLLHLRPPPHHQVRSFLCSLEARALELNLTQDHWNVRTESEIAHSAIERLKNWMRMQFFHVNNNILTLSFRLYCLRSQPQMFISLLGLYVYIYFFIYGKFAYDVFQLKLIIFG